ncbi:MAG TPA: rhomboid family intramembrane serine protease [Acidobacteriaceae bacterium]|jgi:rhomboid protease GluP|nr:rhomboid family intramembrane serine protease [Acidobacteriaceae bacterium]
MASYPPPSGFPTHPPEILPPEQVAAQQEELRAVRERLPGQRSEAKRSWAYAPATYVLVGINCAMFIAMVMSHGSLVNSSDSPITLLFANNAGAVLHDGQWWRIFTAMFVHAGFIHLAGNMWCLWNLGLLGEPLIGPGGVLATYIFSGAAGNLLSIGVAMAWTDASKTGGPLGVGASGAVFGLAGVLIVLLKSPRLPIPPKELSGLRRYVIYFAVINFVIGFGGNRLKLGINIDNMAHLGGFLGGILFALPLVPLLGSSKSAFLLRRRVAVGLMTGILVFFGFYLSVVFPPSAFQP